MKPIISVFILGFLTISIASAKLVANESLNEAVSEKFLTEGSTPNSGLGQAILQTIGRQITRDDFEVITLSTQKMENPWEFAYIHNEKTCRAGDNSSEFLILLKVKIKNLNASTFATLSFKVNAEQALLATRSDQAAIDNCTDVSENDDNFIVTPPYNLIGNFMYVELAQPKK